jgi:hypothetical protein
MKHDLLYLKVVIDQTGNRRSEDVEGEKAPGKLRLDALLHRVVHGGAGQGSGLQLDGG